jgi:hypothetical protein
MHTLTIHLQRVGLYLYSVCIRVAWLFVWRHSKAAIYRIGHRVLEMWRKRLCHVYQLAYDTPVKQRRNNASNNNDNRQI